MRDAELFRQPLGVDRWSVLGQSFGGFCSLTYLSFAADGLREAFFTGGLPPVGRPVDEVYAATYATQLRAQPALLRALPAATATGCGRCSTGARRARSGCRTAT